MGVPSAENREVHISMIRDPGDPGNAAKTQTPEYCYSGSDRRIISTASNSTDFTGHTSRKRTGGTGLPEAEDTEE